MKENNVKPIFIWKTQKINSMFTKFKKEMFELGVLGKKEDEVIIKLTLDNLFHEIVSATGVIRRMKKK